MAFQAQEPERSIVRLEPILQAEATHGPIFRRELFDISFVAWQKAAAADIAEANESEHEAGDKGPEQVAVHEFKVHDIYDNETVVYIPKGNREGQVSGKLVPAKPSWCYQSLQDLGQTYSNGRRLLPYLFGLNLTTANPDACFQEEELYAKSILWNQAWQQSSMCSKLTMFLSQNISVARQVNKIVCFGLGCFPAHDDRSAKRAYIQHLSARTIRDTIAELQGGDAPKVYVQGPTYCTKGISWIQNLFGFKVVNDPEGFRALDGHTFMVSVAPNAPVRQITMGFTHEFGGPAGMFCNAVDSDGTECNGKGDTMIRGRLTVPFRADEASPAVWKYKQESMWMEHNDYEEEDFFGAMGVYMKARY